MSLSSDLLEQASQLVRNEPRKPKQASLRRAVSAAYYALFHLLGEEAAARLKARFLSSVIRRVLQHGEMKAICGLYSAGKLPDRAPYSNRSVSQELAVVATAFVDLQEARHKADYDPSFRINRTVALRLIERTLGAFRSWKRIRRSEEATLFLFALLFHSRWLR